MDYSKIHPLNGVIVLKMKGTSVTQGGIYLVNAKRLDEADVIAVGPGEWLQRPGKKPEFREVGVKVGDSVVIGPGSGIILEVEMGDEVESLTFMSETDVVAVIRKDV